MKIRMKRLIRNGVGFVLSFGLFYWMSGDWKSAAGFLVGIILFTMWCDWYDNRTRSRVVERRIDELKNGHPMVEDYLVIELIGDDAVMVSNDLSYLEQQSTETVNYEKNISDMIVEFTGLLEKYPQLMECVQGRTIDYRIVNISDDDSEEILASRMVRA